MMINTMCFVFFFKFPDKGTGLEQLCYVLEVTEAGPEPQTIDASLYV